MNPKRTKQTPAVIEPAAEPHGIISILDKLMANPDLPIERAEQAYTFYLRVQEDQKREHYAAAMVACQADMMAIKVDADNPQTKSKYATYDAIDRVLRPIYTRHGFGLSYNTKSLSPDVLTVIAYLTHSSGYEREFSIDMPADGKGAKGGDVMTKTHATGSAFTYGKRYLISAIFNVATTKRDDDGNAAGGEVGVITKEQVAELDKLIKATKTDIAKFLEMGGIDDLSDMPANQFKAAKALLKKKMEHKQ
jgi:hypothetical protein